MKVFRLRSSNAAEAGANKASDLWSLVRRVGRLEQREQHHRQLSRVRRHSSKNAVASQHDDQLRNQIGVDRNKFRRRSASEDLSVNDSGRRRPWVAPNVSSVAELRQKFGNRSRNLVVEDRQVKHAAKEKEYKVPMVSRRISSSSGSSSEAARLAQPSADRRKGRGSRKAGKRGHQKKRHRHNNFGAITPVAPE